MKSSVATASRHKAELRNVFGFLIRVKKGNALKYPTMTYSITSIFFGMLATIASWPSMAAAVGIPTLSIGKPELLQQNIAVNGELVTALSMQDSKGPHILVLTSISGSSRQQESNERKERIDLRASYYSKVRSTAGGGWTEEWNIKDHVDCPGLDSSASFFARHVTVTDLNGDGVAEVTVPYKMFCGGGVDSDTIKIIMRQGPEKYALRGESLIRVPGQEDFGGDYKIDAALSLPRNAAYQQHLLKVWKQVYIRITP
jgi:hypothetical protein